MQPPEDLDLVFHCYSCSLLCVFVFVGGRFGKTKKKGEPLRTRKSEAIKLTKAPKKTQENIPENTKLRKNHIKSQKYFFPIYKFRFYPQIKLGVESIFFESIFSFFVYK